VTTELPLMVFLSEVLVAERLSSVSALKQNLDFHRFKDDRDMKKDGT
jgi:hypothetical protein